VAAVPVALFLAPAQARVAPPTAVYCHEHPTGEPNPTRLAMVPVAYNDMEAGKTTWVEYSIRRQDWDPGTNKYRWNGYVGTVSRVFGNEDINEGDFICDLVTDGTHKYGVVENPGGAPLL
jgi:hypothetical protein